MPQKRFPVSQDQLISFSIGLSALIFTHLLNDELTFLRITFSIVSVICFAFCVRLTSRRYQDLNTLIYIAAGCHLFWAIIETLRIHFLPITWTNEIQTVISFPVMVVGGFAAFLAIDRPRNRYARISFIILLLFFIIFRNPGAGFLTFLLVLFQIPYRWVRLITHRDIYRIGLIGIASLSLSYLVIFPWSNQGGLIPKDWCFVEAGVYSTAALLLRAMIWVICLTGCLLPFKPRRIQTRLRWAFLFNFIVPFSLLMVISTLTLLFIVGGYQIAAAKRLMFRFGLQAQEQAQQLWETMHGVSHEPPAHAPFYRIGLVQFADGTIQEFGEPPEEIENYLRKWELPTVEFLVTHNPNWELWIAGFYRASNRSSSLIAYRIDRIMLENISEILGLDLILIEGSDLGLFPMSRTPPSKTYTMTEKIIQRGTGDRVFPIGAVMINATTGIQSDKHTLILPLATLKVLASRKSLVQSLLMMGTIPRFNVIFKGEKWLQPETITLHNQSNDDIDIQSINLFNLFVLIMLAMLGGLLVALVILSLSTSHLISRKINQSVRLLKIGTTQLDKGCLNHRIPVITQDELGELADDFNRMAVSIKNFQMEREHLLLERVEKERMQKDFENARLLQRSLLPIKAPLNHALEIAGVCFPAEEVGGDYYDYIELPNGQMGIVIGDVSGHGMSAGLLMSMAKSCIFNQVRMSGDVEELLHALNDMIFNAFQRKRLMTLLYAVFDPDGRSFRFASAGHHFPYVYRKESQQLLEMESVSYPLGVRSRLVPVVREIKTSPGDLIIFYTDGVIETLDSNGDLLGFERFEEAIRSLVHHPVDVMVDKLMRTADEFRQDAPITDDRTLVIVRVRETYLYE